MNIPGLITGTLALASLEVVTSSTKATDRLGGLAAFGAAVVKRVLDPTVALIPNWHDGGAATTTGGIATGTEPDPLPGQAGGVSKGTLALPKHPSSRLVKPSPGAAPIVAPAP